MNWQTVMAVDFDSAAIGTYRANFPNVDARYGTVADLIPEMPAADVIIGGPPCQPFSEAGDNKGEDDARDGIPDFCSAVAAVRPRMFLMENVRGLLNANHLRYFGNVLKRLESLGYVVEYRVFDAVQFGVPQFRGRVWVWGIRADLYNDGIRHLWPTPTHCWPPQEEGLFGVHSLLPGVTVGQALELEGQIFRHRGSKWGERRAHTSGEPAPTVLGGSGDGGSTGAMYYRWSDAMRTKHPPMVPWATAPTVQAKWHKGGAEGLIQIVDDPHHPPHTLDAPAYTLRSGGAGHGMPNLYLAVDSTLNSPSPTISAGSHTGGPEPINNRIRAGFVRRLLPDECARLQSVHDGFRWPDGISKTAKYRVIGNGWASRMGAVFADAFHAADPESRTVIDLFCGGGLGAVGWHGRYWKYEKCGACGVARGPLVDGECVDCRH